MRRNLGRALCALGIAAAGLGVVAAPAGAALVGPCEASGTLVRQGFTVDPKITDEITVERSDDVKWTASVPGQGRRAIAGRVQIEFPPPIGTVDVGRWKSRSDLHANEGTYAYDLPGLLAGVEIPVRGVHREADARCVGRVVVTIDGNPLSNPAAIASLALTAVSGLGLFVAMRPKGMS